MAHPVDFHCDRKVGRIDFAYPIATELHVKEQVHGDVVGVLSVGTTVDFGVCEGELVVDEESQAVGSNFDSVDVEVVAVDYTYSTVRWIFRSFECVCVVAVDSLVGFVVVV